MPPSDSIWVASCIYQEMVEFAQKSHPRETGGMLLGYEAIDGSSVVTKIVGPGPKARHGHFRFTPDGNYQQGVLEEHFWATDGRETYLGDWHTHPTSDSTPSLLDKHTLARIAMEPASGTCHPLMVIMGGASGNWRFGAVRLLGAKRRLFWFDCRLEALSPVFF
jgi:integrative and conjugative element protein (TIGR02256 family)